MEEFKPKRKNNNYSGTDKAGVHYPGKIFIRFSTISPWCGQQ